MPLNRHKTGTNGANTSRETGSSANATAIQARVDGVDWTTVQADLTPRDGPLCRNS
jgi:hypothetical protein